jgi:hypothetical protein
MSDIRLYVPDRLLIIEPDGHEQLVAHIDGRSAAELIAAMWAAGSVDHPGRVVSLDWAKVQLRVREPTRFQVTTPNITEDLSCTLSADGAIDLMRDLHLVLHRSPSI